MKQLLSGFILGAKAITLFCLSTSFFSIINAPVQAYNPCHTEVQKADPAVPCEACLDSKNSWEIQATISNVPEEQKEKETVSEWLQVFCGKSNVISQEFFESAPPPLFETASYTREKQIIVLRV